MVSTYGILREDEADQLPIFCSAYESEARYGSVNCPALRQALLSGDRQVFSLNFNCIIKRAESFASFLQKQERERNDAEGG